MRLTLCGSARFEQAFKEWNELLTLAGHTVYSLAVYPSDKGQEKDWYTNAQKIQLEAAHIRKINNSDAIVVLNVDGYYGGSTQKEIIHAVCCGKRVFWLQHGPDALSARALLRGDYSQPDTMKGRA